MTQKNSQDDNARSPFSLPNLDIESLFKHPLTEIGLKQFLADWERAQAVRV